MSGGTASGPGARAATGARRRLVQIAAVAPGAVHHSTGDRSIDVARVQFTGWKALVVLALLAGYAVLRYHTPQVTLDTAARDAVRSSVAAEYQGGARAPGGLGPVLDSAAVADLLEQRGVEIPSITGRGSSDNVVVQVEMSVRGGPPPDGRPVRYFRLLHLTRARWRVVGESSVVRYYTRLW